MPDKNKLYVFLITEQGDYDSPSVLVASLTADEKDELEDLLELHKDENEDITYDVVEINPTQPSDYKETLKWIEMFTK